ncbi:hypothetical protein CPB85DRAFT_1226753, partial [Mucidula mucida]
MAPRPQKTGRTYKPADRKYRPVPSYMPDPEAQKFGEIPVLPPTKLPTHPVDYRELVYDEIITADRMQYLLDKIDHTAFTKDEINLFAYVILARSKAFAFVSKERGTFDPKYYPDYEVPVIEHTPWQEPPIQVPRAVEPYVRDELRRGLAEGKFAPCVASYRSPMFTVKKKPG